MDGLTMEGFKDNSRGAMRENFDNSNQVIKAPVDNEVKKTITVKEKLTFTPEQYSDLAELLADNSRDLGDKIAKALGLNARQLGDAFNKAISQTPEKPKGLI